VEHSHDKTYTPDEEFQIARAVWEHERDARHAANHLAAALVADPHHPDRLALLDEMIAGCDDPLAMAPLDDAGNYIGTVAVRGYILARTGRVGEAVDLIAQVHHANPGIPFLEWAVDWLTADPGAAGSVAPGALARFFGTLIGKYPGNVIDAPAARAELALALRFHEAAVPADDPDTMLRYARVALLRKLGRLDEAEGLARGYYEAAPNYHFATALAMIRQSRGDADGWADWMRAAIDHDPADAAARRDLGDWHLGRGEFAEAAKWYQEAIDREPDDGWSIPSLYFANHQLGRDGGWLEKLAAFAADHPENDRARSLLRAGRPYATYLPAPAEAILNLLPRFVEAWRKDPADVPTGAFKVTLSALEAPSARLAFEVQLRAMGCDPDLRITVSNLQTPDPRLPRAEVTYRVWRYREDRKLLGKKLTTDPVAAVPEPPAAVAAAVARIAATPYDRAAWYTAAGAAVTGAPVRPSPVDVLGVMAHPPELPDGWYAPDWVLRCQLAAALAAAHLGDGRRVLLDLARGPYDWTVTAAVVALTEAAQRDPAVTTAALPVFLDLLRDQPRPGYVCYEYAAACCVQQLPGVPDDVREHFARYQEQMEQADADEEDGEEGGQ